ncbi:unnamed protein product [Rhizoctonia solani]|uniref:Iminophenyl-pyruvate dimer synthase domain-containing protein n=1 Tax=Rhizoctonia solani TaxID=456999 RepID=A0A8H3DQP1_9AGAM|nr:unnamed protein product [Rhizoctonia solani]
MSQVQKAPEVVQKAPKSCPTTWTLEELHAHLQAAVSLELCTIPLYLYAMYSIELTGHRGKEAHCTLLEVVVQEMIHLGLAGNILTALGGRPRVYGEAFTPKYPSELLYEGVLMTLAPADKHQLKAFAEIERPAEMGAAHSFDIPEPPNDRKAVQYLSIGEFYKAIMEGMHQLNNSGSLTFDKNSTGKQWIGKELHHKNPECTEAPTRSPIPELAPITDYETAILKLNLIIDEGEGRGLTDTGKGAEPTESSHYDRFKKLSGYPELNVYPLVSNPKTSLFKDLEDTKYSEHCYPAMLAFDAAYSYLLLTLEAGWTYEGPGDINSGGIGPNLHNLMTEVMGPISKVLVRQKLKNFQKNAAPPFNLYTFNLHSSPKDEIKALIEEAISRYSYPKEDKEQLEKALKGVGDLHDIKLDGIQ